MLSTAVNHLTIPLRFLISFETRRGAARGCEGNAQSLLAPGAGDRSASAAICLLVGGFTAEGLLPPFGLFCFRVALYYPPLHGSAAVGSGCPSRRTARP
jgi:hypothetical protein